VVVRKAEVHVDCNECEEQVLDLIEREALDPEGVRATLAKCPECRAKFDELKAMLAVTQQLPLEAPPDHLDVLILQAAEARTGGDAPASPRTRSWGQPLAMAAVALLVVGIGISTVSIVKHHGQEQIAEAPAADEVVAPPADLEEALGDGEPERIELAKATTDQPKTPADDSDTLGAARQVRATRARAPKKKEARGAAGPRASTSFAAEGDLQRVASAQDEAGEQLPEERDAAPEPNQIDATTKAQRQCASRISAFEKQTKSDDEYEPTAEESLDAGLCYQLLGKRAAARYWLKRAAEDPSTKARAEDALEKLE